MTAPLGVVRRADARAAHLHPHAHAQLIGALEDEERVLATQLAQLEADLQGLTATSADDVSERDLAETHAARTRENLESVQAALARVAAGTFGRCISCDEAIPVERLQAVPDARYCVACPPRRRRLA